MERVGVEVDGWRGLKEWRWLYRVEGVEVVVEGVEVVMMVVEVVVEVFEMCLRSVEGVVVVVGVVV